jgi:hypothetical protein
VSRATLVLHGERAGGRPVGSPAVLPLPGPDMYSDEPGVAEAKLARLALLSGAWRTAPKTGGPDAKGDYLLGLKAPAALLFPAAARHALLRRPPAKGCHWCVARFLSLLDGQPDPAPSDPLRAFLGKPCPACEHRHAVNARLAEVRAETPIARIAAAARYAPKPTGGTLQERIDYWAGKLGIPPDQRPPPPPPSSRRRGRPGAAARRQPPSAWNGPTLRRAMVPRGRPR